MQRNKVNIEFNEKEQDVAEVIIFLETHADIFKDWNERWAAIEALDTCLNKMPGIAYSRILEISAEVWGINEKALLEKPNHNKGEMRIQIMSFYYACNKFNSGRIRDFESFLGRSTYRMYTTSNEEIMHHVKNKGTYCKNIVRLFLALMRECPNRISNAIKEFVQTQKKLLKVEFKMFSYYNEKNGMSMSLLTAYQIAKIPIRNADWFIKNGRMFTIYACSDSGKEIVYIDPKKNEIPLLLRLQSQGYKLVGTSEALQCFSNYHPICDRCLHRNVCSYNTAGLRGKRNIFGKPFECFEDVPGSPLKVDIELLYPLSQVQMQ